MNTAARPTGEWLCIELQAVGVLLHIVHQKVSFFGSRQQNRSADIAHDDLIRQSSGTYRCGRLEPRSKRCPGAPPHKQALVRIVSKSRLNSILAEQQQQHGIYIYANYIAPAVSFSRSRWPCLCAGGPEQIQRRRPGRPDGADRGQVRRQGNRQRRSLHLPAQLREHRGPVRLPF